MLVQGPQIGHLIDRVTAAAHQADPVHRHFYVVCGVGDVGGTCIARVDGCHRTKAQITARLVKYLQQSTVAIARRHWRITIDEFDFGMGHRQVFCHDFAHTLFRRFPLRRRYRSQITLGVNGAGNDVGLTVRRGTIAALCPLDLRAAGDQTRIESQVWFG